MTIEDRHWWYIGRRKLIERYLKPGKILEVGCGGGGNIRYFKDRGVKIQGIDPIKIEGLGDMVVGRAEKLPFEQNKFDTILMLDVLEHIEDDLQALKECYRVIKPGGRLILAVPIYSWMWSRWDKVMEHTRRYEVDRLTKLIKRVGFIQNDIFCYYSFALVPVYIFRKIKQVFQGNSYKSDFVELNFGNKILMKLADLERWFIKIGLRLPFGLSVMMILIKK